MNAADRNLVQRVIALPTAPFHEEAVGAFIRDFARHRQLPCRRDRWGNLHLRLRIGKDVHPVCFEAHMDHPGCELVRGTGRDWTARFLGGHDARHFPGGRFLVHAADGTTIRGRAVSTLRARHHHAEFDLRLGAPLADGTRAFGMWDLVPAAVRGDRFVTRAADDLAGCAVILATIDRLRRRRVPCNLQAIFTRAEEVGFVGASGLMEHDRLPKRAPIIVLEASKELPGARIGGGPVVRVGDKSRVYDADAEAWIHETAQHLARRGHGFRFQRQLMAGGTCEAGLYAMNGHRAAGIALPLGHYHNLGRARPAAEEIGLDDVANAVRLCAALATAPPATGPGRLAAHAQERFRHMRRRLLDG